MRPRALVLAACLLLLALGVSHGLAQGRGWGVAGVRVTVFLTGDAIVEFEVDVREAPSLVELPSLGTPVGVIARLGNETLPVEISESFILVGVDKKGLVEVSYVTQDLVQKVGGRWWLNASLLAEAVVVLPRRAVPVELDPLPGSVFITDDERVGLRIGPGEVSIAWVIALPPEEPAPTPPGPGVGLGALLAVLAGVAAAIALLVLFVRGRAGRGRGPRLELDYRDEEIINALRSLGGRATAQELMRETGIPKTPLYRRLRRLEEAGVIGSERVRGVTYYYLRSPPRSRLVV